jgi:RNA polymerase sigma factor (sigma-70 family)
MDIYRQRLMSAARRLLPSRADAEDAVQDTYVRALAASPKVGELRPGWLHTVLRNIAIDQLRRRKLESEHAQDGSLPDQSMESLLEAETECQAALRHLLDRVRPDEAAGILLTDVFELDYEEIARILGKTEAASRQFLHRARARARSGPAADFGEDYVSLCWRAIEARDPASLIDMLQATTVRAQQALSAGGRHPAARSVSKLVQVNGRFAIALMLDGVVLCIVPVGTQTTLMTEPA